MKTIMSLGVVAACWILLLQGEAPAQNKAAEMLVGKWTPASGKEKGTFVAFTADGEMTYTFGKKDDMTYKGKYKVLDKKIEVEWSEETLKKNNLLPKQPKAVPYSITKGVLIFDPSTLVNVKKTWIREK
jgi:uncharacterized protein (TIGR03066 family)